MRTVLGRMLALLRFLRFGRRDLAEARQQNQRKQLQLQQTRKRLRSVEQQNRRMRRRLQRAEQRLEHKERLPKQQAREYLLRKMPKQSVCAEIGVDEGVFSRKILHGTEPRRLHLIDPWSHEKGEEYEKSRYGGLGSDGQIAMDERYEAIKALFAEEIQAGQVKMHREFSNVVSDDFEAAYFDWVYIDGNHLYKFVEQDLRLYYPKVKPGGYITGDDYGIQGWWENGVQKAVDEFVAETPGATLEVWGTQFIIEKGKNDSATEQLSRADQKLRKIRQETGSVPQGRLPDFLLLGAQKCGTGFLFKLLSQHPDVEPAVTKEVNYFSKYFHKDADWYRSCFPAPARRGQDGRPVWTWEASPNYIFYPHAARRAAEILPRAKLMVLLRNPVDRAYSHYRH